MSYVIENHCGGVFPDFLSLDAEGVDEIILTDLHNLNSLPKVICVETAEYSTTGDGRDSTAAIFGILEPLGYMLYANTCINSIFVLRELLK